MGSLVRLRKFLLYLQQHSLPWIVWRAVLILSGHVRNMNLVIVDRYVASNLAYQSARITNPERVGFTEWLFNLEYEIYDLPKPDLTLFLEVAAHTSRELVARKETRTYTEKVYDLHERDSIYLSNVREVYHVLITSQVIDPCLIIDCQDRHGTLRAMDDIGQEICNAVVQYKNSDAGAV